MNIWFLAISSEIARVVLALHVLHKIIIGADLRLAASGQVSENACVKLQRYTVVPDLNCEAVVGRISSYTVSVIVEFHIDGTTEGSMIVVVVKGFYEIQNVEDLVIMRGVNHVPH